MIPEHQLQPATTAKNERKLLHLSQKSAFVLSWNGCVCVEYNFTANDLI